MSFYNGKKIQLSIFGQSHSAAIGMSIDGLPSGVFIDLEQLHTFLKRRAPKLPTDTSRIEPDDIEVLSGIVDGYSCGTAISMIIYNRHQRSSDYDSLDARPRPGHCDYPAYAKYGKYHDFRGGGHFSGRLTAALCLAGGICIQLLQRQGIKLAAHIYNIGEVYDLPFDELNPDSQIELISLNDRALINDNISGDIDAEIRKYALSGDSVGGSVECAITGLPAGTGYTMFDSLESRISQCLFAVPAVKAVEFGIGFGCTSISGSAYNDEYYIDGNKISAYSNRSGGINGGLSNGMPLIFRTAVRPTPSIAAIQRTVDLSAMQNTEISIKGRHDCCIVPRIVPCIEAAAAIACYDAL